MKSSFSPNSLFKKEILENKAFSIPYIWAVSFISS